MPPDRRHRTRRRVLVHGVVQGVGFRPHVYALARSLQLSGEVWNTSDGVVAEVEGDLADVDAFCTRVGPEAPPLARVQDVSWGGITVAGGTAFTVRASAGGPGRTFVSPDVAICADCLSDLGDPTNRRYRHPFVTCTNCGPRFTITTGLPYDRSSTTMAGFAMCAECAVEYADPGDRRFHAQTICCPHCGPLLSLVRPDRAPTYDQQALAEARRLLADGAVLAVKGIGGYHLACDATSEPAVATLRKRKQRGDKPFALMVGDVETAQELVVLDGGDARLLTDRTRPVVLAPARGDDARREVAASVAPGNADLGVMLAYTPLHHLLLGLPGDPPGPDVLVMTSGNLAGEPIVTDDDEALHRLDGMADAWLAHDRRIHVPCDDSVTRMVADREAPVRRSRGHAPLPLTLPFEAPPVLGVGGDLKNTFCVAEGRLAWMSAHVGDMDDLATLTAFTTAEHQLEQLTGVRPEHLAVDRHPAYRSRMWGLDHAGGRPVHGVQHHHAHVAATMAEHGVAPGRTVLGIAFDGTGYGDDGAVWGGELLVADYAGFTRAGHLAYVALPGGDAGVANPCRMALSHLRSAGVPWAADLPCVRACHGDELRLLDRQLATGFGCAPTSSMGRLFDAVSSIAGICHRAEYDAQAAMELEAAARRCGPVDGYPFAVDTRVEPCLVDAAPVVSAAAADVLAGTDPAVVAARFQHGVVDMVVTVAEHLRRRTGLGTVTLSGGVFLNAFLTSGCATALAARGFEVLRHERVPASDAGIALGQVAVLAHAGSRRPTTSPGRSRPPDKETPCA